MTDRDIMQAFEKCKMSDCDNCDIVKRGLTCNWLYKKVSDLLERQDKLIDELMHKFELLWREGKSEAIKAFVMKLKIYVLNPNKDFFVMLDEIDKLAEETIGDAHEYN